MPYVAVKGGEKAIENAEQLLQAWRRGDREIPELTLEQIQQQLALAVNRVMAEGSLYDPELAALAIKQSWGDLVEAIFLLRAYRTTLPRFYYTQPLDTNKMFLKRRISAIFKDVPGGQKLGVTFDYIHRLLDFKLAAEGNAPEAPKIPLKTRDRNIPRVIDTLDKEGLIQEEIEGDREPFDLTRQPLYFPAQRDARLQNLARADEGFLLSLAYSSQRGYGKNHPFAGEIRMGEVEVIICPDELGFEIAIAEITISEVQMVNQFQGNREIPPQFTRGYGLTFGYNERKAMAMAIVDRALSAQELGEEIEAPVQDEEFVLSHSDNIEAQGFVQHLKLPHYIDFQAELNLIRKMRNTSRQLLIQDMIIRPEKTADYLEITEVNRLAFGQENEAQLVNRIRQGDRYIPELSLVAEVAGKIVGHILFSKIDLVGEKKQSVLGLAPMAVLPEFQNQGIGSQLVREGLAIADRMNIPCVIVLGHSWFYPRFGFEPAEPYGIEPPFPLPPEVFMVKYLSHCQQKYTGKIIYPPEFDEV
ncbi:MAG: carbon-phosphorus lyase complex subunit PhnI [Cyanobacteria bacterium SBLK]|nr:carbon-phosphorus lyase complex subunit PhnI [Cyanobacteria bacterium SBLK]